MIEKIEDDVIELETSMDSLENTYSIILKTRNVQIGSIEYRGYHYDSQIGDIGYMIHRNYRGHGFAQRALILLSQHLNENNVLDFWITCNRENAESLKQIIGHGDIVDKKFVTEDIMFFNCKTKEKAFTKQKTII